MMKDLKPRILFIDAYDSFSNNICCILQEDLGVDVTKIEIDTSVGDLNKFVQKFAAVVIGPGPGHPANASDVGLIDLVWKLSEECLLPVLGICLGFQSLVLSHGGIVEPLPQPRHGIIRTIRTLRNGIFSHDSLRAVQYHSLHASLDHSIGGQSSSTIWQPTHDCPNLVPLAWDYEDDNEQDQSLMCWSGNPPAILMAVRHCAKPFWGVQFHPESICSESKARGVLRSWWSEAQDWSAVYRKSPYGTFGLDDPLNMGGGGRQPHGNNLDSSKNEATKPRSEGPTHTVRGLLRVMHMCFTGHLSVSEVCRILKVTTSECIVLDSEQHQRPEIGRYTIIGVIDTKTSILEYNPSDACITFRTDQSKAFVPLDGEPSNVFAYLKSYMQSRKAIGGNPSIPFWGGLMGFISYEACLATIRVGSTLDKNIRSSKPDMSFAFIERSVVIDYELREIHIQSIRPGDYGWVQKTVDMLKHGSFPAHPKHVEHPHTAKVTMPNNELYKAAIRKCQTAIHKGDSYELCLTTQASINTDQSHTQPWPLYLRLRALNPAPFSAFIRLGGLTLLSSSPERFLSWSRPSRSTSHDCMAVSVCQFRPIKGTVKKQAHKGAVLVSFSIAEQILSTPKEKAENLMIVDLIRHDLHGIAGPGNVRVRQLMVVEEYATLFQLVTVIEGDLLSSPESGRHTNGDNMNGQGLSNNVSQDARAVQVFGVVDQGGKYNQTGIDVLAASLPPGSMTGAPKKRSCQILQTIEQHRPRGIYSGVVGYMDVGGGGDFSVVIRSAVRWDDDQHDQGDVWTVGAGGAVTSLSTEDGEWDEMLAKLRSTLRLFDDDG